LKKSDKNGREKKSGFGKGKSLGEEMPDQEGANPIYNPKKAGKGETLLYMNERPKWCEPKQNQKKNKKRKIRGGGGRGTASIYDSQYQAPPRP